MEAPVLDLVYVAGLIGFFLLCAWAVRACERI